jgi:hypothetical protein
MYNIWWWMELVLIVAYSLLFLLVLCDVVSISLADWLGNPSDL